VYYKCPTYLKHPYELIVLKFIHYIQLNSNEVEKWLQLQASKNFWVWLHSPGLSHKWNMKNTGLNLKKSTSYCPSTAKLSDAILCKQKKLKTENTFRNLNVQFSQLCSDFQWDISEIYWLSSM